MLMNKNHEKELLENTVKRFVEEIIPSRRNC